MLESRTTAALHWSLTRTCALLLVVLGRTASHAQTAAPTAPPVPAIKTSSTLVIVPAWVRTPAGSPLLRLRPPDFSLLDNNEPQTIMLDQHQRTAPVSLVVLLQTGGAAAREFSAYATLGTMISYLVAGAPHEVALVEFDSQPEYTWSFTRKTEALDDSFRHPDAGDDGAAILDALQYGISLLRTRPPANRRILLLVSQTQDERSHAAGAEIIRALGENNITVECLTFSPEKAWVKDQLRNASPENKPYTFAPNIPPLLHTFNLDRPLKMAIKAMRQNTAGAVAELSGGESLSFSSAKDLDQRLAGLANDLSAEYVLSFRPTSKQPGFHTLELSIPSQPKARVSARRGYWQRDAGDAGSD